VNHSQWNLSSVGGGHGGGGEKGSTECVELEVSEINVSVEDLSCPQQPRTDIQKFHHQGAATGWRIGRPRGKAAGQSQRGK